MTAHAAGKRRQHRQRRSAGRVIGERMDPTTPSGDPTGPNAEGRLGNKPWLFLARHGAGHKLLPHEVNYRANIDALKAAGATQILGLSAVASPVQHNEPGDLAVPSQYVDWTQGRARAQLLQRRRGGACRDAAIGIFTHDDCWLEDPAQHVTGSSRSSAVMARVWPAAPTEACGRRP